MDHNTSNTTNQPVEDGQTEGFSPLAKDIFICYYSVVFFAACMGNVLALLTCYKTYRTTNSILLCYIASLATADLLFTLLSTFDLAYFFVGDWVGGNGVCKLQSFLIESSYTVSILNLVAISYERLKAVLSPVMVRARRRRHGTFVPQLTWCASIVVCTPLLYAYSVEKDEDGNNLCVNTTWGDKGRQIYYGIQAVLLFLVPLSFMTWAHVKIFRVLGQHITARNKVIRGFREGVKQRRATKMLALVTLLFTICYVPFVVIRTLRYFYVYTGDEVWKFAQLLIFTQTAFNPMIYCFYSNQFKLSYKDLLRCRFKVNEISKTRLDSTRPMSSFRSDMALSFVNLSFKLKELDTTAQDGKHTQ